MFRKFPILLGLSFIFYAHCGHCKAGSVSFSRENYPKIQGRGSGKEGTQQLLFAYDFIRVDVFQELDLLTETEINGDGHISLPLIGKIKLSGLSIQEAQDLIEQQYKEKEILINPQINIIVLKPAERIIHIQGQVNRPGPVMMPHSKETMTLSELISAASDVNLRSNPSKTQVKTTDESGKQYVYNIDYKKIRSGAIEDILLKNGDEVYIPESIF